MNLIFDKDKLPFKNPKDCPEKDFNWCWLHEFAQSFHCAIDTVLQLGCKTQFIGNIVGQKEFDLDFKVNDLSCLKVYQNGVLLVNETEYNTLDVTDATNFYKIVNLNKLELKDLIGEANNPCWLKIEYAENKTLKDIFTCPTEC